MEHLNFGSKMRPHFYILLFAFVFGAPHAQAMPQCATIDTLIRLTTLLSADTSEDGEINLVQTINAVSDEISTFDPDAVEDLFSNLQTPDDHTNLSQLVNLAGRFLRVAIDKKLTDASNLISSDDATEKLGRARATLKELQCGEIKAIPLIQAVPKPLPPTATVGRPLNSNTLKPEGDGRKSMITAIAITTLVVAFLIFWRMYFLGRRRRKRHSLYYVVRWRNKGAQGSGIEGAILDINCFGAKLDVPSPPPEGTIGEILISEEWHKARVQWTRGTSCGLKLVTALSRTGVLTIIKDSKKIVLQS